MRQVVPDALYFGFECLSKNTPMEGADVKIENIPIKGRCRNCQYEFILKNWLDNCQMCGRNHVEIISGNRNRKKQFIIN